MARLLADGAARGRGVMLGMREHVVEIQRFSSQDPQQQSRGHKLFLGAPRALADGLGMPLRAGKELSRAGVKRRCDLEDVRETRIARSALNATYIGAVQTALQRQTFLRDTSLLANRSDGLTECDMRRRPNRHNYSFPP